MNLEILRYPIGQVYLRYLIGLKNQMIQKFQMLHFLLMNPKYH